MLIKIETFNVGLLTTPLTDIIPFVEQRFAGIVKAYKRSDVADIICITEIFEQSHRERLATAVRDTHPCAISFDNSTMLRKNNGLMILSRFPLRDPGFTAFKNSSIDEKLFCEKGVLSATAYLPNGSKLRILLTHLIAGGLYRHPESPEMDAIRAKQIEELLAIAADGITEHVIVGDRNCGPGVSPINFKQLLDSGYDDAYASAEYLGLSPSTVTWDPKNPLNVDGPHKMCPPQLIDGIMIARKANIRSVSANITRTDACIPTKKGSVTLSDHYAVEATLST